MDFKREGIHFNSTIFHCIIMRISLIPSNNAISSYSDCRQNRCEFDFCIWQDGLGI